ncbi:MAG: hydroxypyruvate isomerase [Burkholderiales bacterium PBB3]|nr:MAG: hydroxypyruvate isomerase [Burkholderiales bacterium PBB3]
MPQFAANLSFLYPEHAFLDRFAAAARDGFRAVEFLFPYAYPAAQIRQQLDAHGLQLVLFNAPPAGAQAADIATAWEHGARGTAAVPGREAECAYGMRLAVDYALALNCPRIHLMAGCVPPGAERGAAQTAYLHNLAQAATVAAAAGLDVLIEPLNPRDVPGYFLSRQDQAHAILQTVGAPNLKVQMDLYHCQIVEGDVATKLRQYLPTGAVGHIQIAGVPERHEPDQGELNYPYLLDLIDNLGYTGWVGCEYRPRLGTAPGGTSSGLIWRQI